MSTAPFEGSNRMMLHKSVFMFGDVALDSNQQLLAEEDQWFFKIEEDKYISPRASVTSLSLSSS